MKSSICACRTRALLYQSVVQATAVSACRASASIEEPAAPRTVERQHRVLVRMQFLVSPATMRHRPIARHRVGQPAHAARLACIRSEVEGVRQIVAAERALRRQQVAVQRIEDELPRPRGLRIADLRSALRSRNARTRSGTSRSARPVASADDVSGANADDARRRRLPKKRIAVRRDGQLRARFAARIRIAGRRADRLRAKAADVARFA